MELPSLNPRDDWKKWAGEPLTITENQKFGTYWRFYQSKFDQTQSSQECDRVSFNPDNYHIHIEYYIASSNSPI